MEEKGILAIGIALLLIALLFPMGIRPYDVISDIWNFITGLLSGGLGGAIANVFNTAMAPFVFMFQVFIFLIFLVLIGNGTGRMIYFVLAVLVFLNFPYVTFPGDWLQNNVTFLSIPVLSSTTWNLIIYGFVSWILFGGGSRERVKVVIMNQQPRYR